MSTVQTILEKKGTNVVSADESMTVHNATRLMNEKRIGCLVITGTDGKVSGILTERDIVFRVVAAARDPLETPVSEVMSAPVACCGPATSLGECTGVMTQKRMRHLPVLNDDGLCGIISSGDILALQVREHEQTIEYLHEYLYAGRV